MNRILASLSLLVAAGASAGIIDLRNEPTEFDQGSWGNSPTYMYASSVVADDSLLAEFSYRINSGGPIDFQLHVTGSRVDGGGDLNEAPNFGDVRWSSGPLNHDGSGLLEFLETPNIAVAPGEKLWLVLDGSSLGNGQGNIGSVRATGFFNGDYYPGNEFVYDNNYYGNTLTNYDGEAWSHRDSAGEDLAFYAKFTPVPGPGAAALFGLAGLASARRRRA